MDRASNLAIHPKKAFEEPWVMRVRHVDDDTMHGLMSWLLQMRRMRNGVAASAFAFGAALCGFVDTGSVVHNVLVYAILGGVTLLPSLAVGSLGVRRLFLKEATGMGLSKSTAMLLLTRAERRARHLSPFQSHEKKVLRLVEAVKDWERA